MKYLFAFLLLATPALAQPPSGPPQRPMSPLELQAVITAVADQRDHAQNLHAQCRAAAATLNSQVEGLQQQLAAARVELAALKDKPREPPE